MHRQAKDPVTHSPLTSEGVSPAAAIRTFAHREGKRTVKLNFRSNPREELGRLSKLDLGELNQDIAYLNAQFASGKVENSEAKARWVHFIVLESVKQAVLEPLGVTHALPKSLLKAAKYYTVSPEVLFPLWGEWRHDFHAKPVNYNAIAEKLELSPSGAIMFARAMGLPTIGEAMNYWKEVHGKRRIQIVYPERDVTHFFKTDNGELLTKSRVIQRGLEQGCRVYAVAIKNGKGTLTKWDFAEDGTIKHDEEKRAIISNSPITTAAAWLCSRGASISRTFEGRLEFVDVRNQGSDELIAGREQSVEGVSRSTTEAIMKFMECNPENDSYLLFVRKPEEIDASVNEFINRFVGLLKHGSNAVKMYGHTATILPVDDWLRMDWPERVEKDMFFNILKQIREQTHPLIVEEMLRTIVDSNDERIFYPEYWENWKTDDGRARNERWDAWLQIVQPVLHNVVGPPA